MKFAREYEATLQHEQYPQHWIQSSISYRQLKKCIRNIQLELRELGLDSDGIKELLHPNTSGDAADGKYSAFASGSYLDLCIQPPLTNLSSTRDWIIPKADFHCPNR